MKRKKSLPKQKRKSPPSKTTKKARPKVVKDETEIRERTDSLLRSLMDKEREIIQTEDTLVETMKRFRDLFEQSPIGVGIHDTAGELLIVNRAYLNLFGLDSFSKMLQQNLFKDLKLSSKDAEKIRFGHVVQYEAGYDFDKVDFETRHEGAGHILFTVSPIFREKDIIGYMVQGQDITERKQVAESQRLTQLGRLLSDMAHEVNNPLMIISGRAELALIEGIKDEKMRDTLNTILEQCFFAKDIIQRLLKYSRIGKIEKRSVSMQEAIELIVNILHHHFRMSNIVFEKEIESDLPPIRGNEKQLQEVFMNIMRNSADAMPDGGVITVRAAREGHFIRIDIEDTGEGIPPKVLKRIFEPFFTTKQLGIGLGLAICHTIIQEHEGILRYESKVEEGTTATVLLPVENVPGR
ncbi:nitrogen regulation protein NR(II) [Candidatus Omnitrophota bacterium]